MRLQQFLRPLFKRLFSTFFLFFIPYSLGAQTYTDFGNTYQKISSTKAKKAAFVSVLLPKIRKANAAIQTERAFVKKYFSGYLTSNNAFDRSSIVKLSRLAKKYRIKNIYNEQEFLNKIAPIPTSQVLAQAAVESAWGQSRFVTLANNIFGEWTYGKEGIIPENRPEGMRHKIRIFKTLDDSIAAFMLNLNRHRAYHKFRDLRAEFEVKHKQFRGVDGVQTMDNYSGIGKEYNKLLERTIIVNKWGKYDAKIVKKRHSLRWW